MIRKLAMPLALAAGVAVQLQAADALAGPALLVDAASGRVIYANDEATDRWFPASVTKLMTTYVVLKEVHSGRLSLDTPLQVSARAASQQPSKMGFKPGTTVTVDNVLKMMLVKSANDLAVVLAESVGGSVENFADLMNAEARRLGMYDSFFVNPHGLPDGRQYVSAKDLAILARALLNDFPQFSPYYGIGGVQLGKRVFNNTNGLIGRYPGADGMKTGYICSSGFNVVATATRNGRRLIAVVLGERTSTARTLHTAALFDRGFSGMSWGSQRLEQLPGARLAAPPDLREDVCGKGRNNLVDDDNAQMAPVAASASGNADSPFAFLLGQGQVRTTPMNGATPGSLVKRAKIEPIPVFTGPAPGSERAPKSVPQEPAIARNVPAVKPAAATAYVPEPAVEAGVAAPMALQGALELLPPPGAGKSKSAARSAPLPPPRP